MATTLSDPSLTFSAPQAPPLALPSFFTGPNDSLATVDNYTATGGTVNSIQDQVANLGISIPDVLRGSKALASVLPIVTGIQNGVLKTNPQALVARLLASSAQITSTFKLLDPSIQSEMLEGLSAVAPVAVTIAGLTKQVSVTNFSNLNQVGNLINSFTGDATKFGIVDPGSIANIVGTIVKQAGGYGVTGTYGAVMAGITDASIISRASAIALPGILQTTDTDSLTQMATLLPPDSITTLDPTALAQYASNYSRTTTGTANQVNPSSGDSASFSALFGTSQAPSTFEMVDSQWNVATRETTAGTATATDITSLMGGSDAFTGMLANGVKALPDDDPRKDYAIAATYPNTDVMQNLQSSFPYVPFSSGTSSVTSGTNSALSSSVTEKVAATFPNASINSSTADTSQYVLTVWGTKVAAGSHSLLGYKQNGQPEYADQGYNDGEVLYPSP